MQISPLDSWIKDKIGYSGSRSFREELNDYTLGKLQENVDYVKKNSRFYKEYFKEIGRIGSFKRFEEIPFTSGSDLLNAPNHFVCVPQNKINRIVTMQSSGTGGPCKRIFFTKEDQELTIDFFQKGMLNLLEKGYKTLILLPSSREGSVGELLKKALKRIEVDSFIFNHIYNKEKLLRIIREKSIDTIVGTPMQLYLLSNYVEDTEGTMDINLKSILLSTDYAPKIVIEKIEKTFNCKV
ncbi:MAG TPA: phenylacetate--CoA ligase family protein, partial [Oscillospiraceae bacterium]|nr:phenylacetate--CoA ligase family protein [Oscillospiraceae bacterium]